MALVFVVARDTGMLTRDRRQVRRRVGDRLDARLLVIRDERDVGLLGRLRFSFATNFVGVGFHGSQDGNLLINTQDFGHLGVELRVPPFKIIAHLVCLHLRLGENPANRALRDPRQTGVPRCRTMLAGMAGQQPRSPQFVRVSHVLGLLAGQRDQPRSRWRRDLRLLSRPRTVIERRHDPEAGCACQATLHRLVRHADRSADRILRRVGPVVQQDSRPFHPARRLRPRAGDRLKLGRLRLADRNRHDLSLRCHDTPCAKTLRRYHRWGCWGNPSQLVGFTESVY